MLGWEDCPLIIPHFLNSIMNVSIKTRIVNIIAELVVVRLF